MIHLCAFLRSATRLPVNSKIATAAFALLAAVLSGHSVTTEVKMVNFAFQPQTVTINVGDTILWTNTTLSSHNVVSSNSAWAASPLFTSPGTFPVTFNNPGTYGYYCSPHRSFGMTGVVIVRQANQAPVVTLGSASAGRTLSAPATVTLEATANDPDGSVANVQFFSGTTLLGSDQTAPYSLVLDNVLAGTYNFTARALDNLGMAATSSVVTITVVNPGSVMMDPVVTLSPGALTLKLFGTSGLSYALDASTDLSTWTDVTNFTAGSSAMALTLPLGQEPRRFFRARLLPNP